MLGTHEHHIGIGIEYHPACEICNPHPVKAVRHARKPRVYKHPKWMREKRKYRRDRKRNNDTAERTAR